MISNVALNPETTRKRKMKTTMSACVFCRRVHMTCDEGRPCQKCIKNNIGDMCYDDDDARSPRPVKKLCACSENSNEEQIPSPITMNNNEVHILNDYLDDMSNVNKDDPQDQFFLTAADPKDGKPEERLNEVINAKYQAGFLKPYNYVNGYARLQRYMEHHMSSDSRQRILNVMGMFRPTFRQVAQSLTDIDLILVEEAFERLLLDYDRVFSAMAIPACLWRRTGEIYKGNKEFAALINVPFDKLRNGQLCIYEIMAEESIVNYWEKYGNIAFDPRQKAVLTSCILNYQKEGSDKTAFQKSDVTLSCCFSFTVRRDKFNIH
ncbi:Putative YALI0E10087p [Rhizopus microsporus]|nr:Putative YALI0E10087p [Rhizopus microsporus]